MLTRLLECTFASVRCDCACDLLTAWGNDKIFREAKLNSVLNSLSSAQFSSALKDESKEEFEQRQLAMWPSPCHKQEPLPAAECDDGEEVVISIEKKTQALASMRSLLRGQDD